MDVVVELAVASPDMRNIEFQTAELTPLDYSIEGRTALLEDRIEDAIAALRRAVEEDPNDIQAQNWLGIALSRQGRYDRSIEAFARSVQLAPANERYWFNLGTAHQAAGHPLRAARYYQVALRLSPDYDRAHQALKGLQVAYPNLPMPPSPTAASPAQVLEELETELDGLHAPASSEPEAVVAVASDGGAAALASPKADLAIIDQPTARFPSLLTRTAAGLIDLCVIQALAILSVILVNLAAIFGAPVTQNGYRILAGAVVGFFYIVFSTAHKGQTLGKMTLRLQVVDREGRVPGGFRATVRTVGQLLNFAPVCMGYLWLAADRRRQTVADKLSRTYVVGRRLDPSSAVPWISGLLILNGFIGYFLYFQVL